MGRQFSFLLSSFRKSLFALFFVVILNLLIMPKPSFGASLEQLAQAPQLVLALLELVLVLKTWIHQARRCVAGTDSRRRLCPTFRAVRVHLACRGLRAINYNFLAGF